MITMMKNWSGRVIVNDKEYDSIEHARNDFKTFSDDMHIKLLSNSSKAISKQTSVSELDSNVEYEIEVKKYMTQKATPEFDFMAKWNNNEPMPMRIMQGTVEKETRGMVYMKLHGLAKPTITCYCCGKELTNPISRHYGIGPVCLGKLGITYDIEDVDNIREELVNITWEGWCIKSAIVRKEVVNATN